MSTSSQKKSSETSRILGDIPKERRRSSDYQTVQLDGDFDPELVGEKYPPGISSVSGATWNLVNTIVGSGIIGLPFAIAQCGFIGGVTLMVLVALATDYTVRLLVETGFKANVRSYDDLAEKAFGQVGYYGISFFIAIGAFGAMVSYMVIIGQTIPDVTGLIFGHDSIAANRDFVIGIVAVCITLPLCCLKDMGHLAFSSFLSIVAVFVIVILVFVKAPGEAIEASEDPHPYSVLNPTVFGGLGAIVFAFHCQQSTFVIFSSMKEPTQKNWGKVSFYSISIAYTLCAAMSLMGYLSFYNCTDGNILENFGRDDVVINVGRILLAITMFFTYPMEQFILRHFLHAMIFHTHDKTNCQHYTLTLLVWGATTGTALATDDLGVVLEIVGSFSSTLSGYIMPTLAFFMIFGYHEVKNDALKCWSTDSPKYEPSFFKKVSLLSRFVVPILIAGVGIAVWTIGTYTGIHNAVTGASQNTRESCTV